MARRRGWHEGTRYKRNDGLFVGRVQFEGTRHQVTSADAKERDRLLRTLIHELEQGKRPTNLPRRKTLEQVVHEWLAEQELTHPATYRTWKSYADSHILTSPLAKMRCNALTPQMITSLYREKLGAGYAQNTVKQIHRTLRACLNWAVTQEVPVPAAVLKMDAPSVDPVDYVQLSPAQVARLFRSLAGDPLEAMWRLCWYTSARLGELLALTWADVNLGAARIQTRRILIKAVDGEPTTRAGKTRASQAVLAIPTDAVDALRRHFVAQQERRAALGDAWRMPRIGDLVFDRGDGGALRHEQAEDAFYAALAAAQLPRTRVHDLRGAGLSALREAGHDVLDVQRRARHASVKTTMDSYVRASDDSDRRVADTLERLIREAN